MNDHTRDIDKWLQRAVIIGPMISGIVFGAVGYIGGYAHAKEQILATGERVTKLEGWRDTQEDFDNRTNVALARIKVIIKDLSP